MSRISNRELSREAWSVPILSVLSRFLLTRTQGPTTPGLFRIPGQVAVVNKLYDHYVSQVRCATREGQEVQTAVRHALLPNTSGSDIHGIASVFKKFLRDIPGGILGSVELFRLLHDIRSRANEDIDWITARPRLIALIFLSMRSAKRLALSSAIFGLLASIKHDQQQSSPLAGEKNFMNSKALGVIFAPILLGALSSRVDFLTKDSSVPTSTDATKRTFLSHLKTPGKQKNKKESPIPELSRGIESSNAAATVIEMLLHDWEAIVNYMKFHRQSPKQR